MQTMDIAIARAFRFTESVNFQFRAEAFNALNHTNLGTPNRFVNTPQFGTITMAMTPGRELQLSARLSPLLREFGAQEAQEKQGSSLELLTEKEEDAGR